MAGDKPSSAPKGMPTAGPSRGANVGGGSSTGRAVFALCGGLIGAYIGFYLQNKYMEERRVGFQVEVEARRRFEEEQEQLGNKVYHRNVDEC